MLPLLLRRKAWTAAAQPRPAASRCRTCTTTASTISAYAELENTDIDNTVAIGAGLANGADGNIGVNAAAGAFNIQKNALVIATVTGGNLAEATAGTLQDVEENSSVHEDTTNNVNIGGSLIGASGNIGVNLASGVGNLQLNTLTIANALAPIARRPGGVTDTGPGGGGNTLTGG